MGAQAQGGAAGQETGGAGFSHVVWGETWVPKTPYRCKGISGLSNLDQHPCPNNLDDLFFKGFLGHDFALVY